VKQGIQKLKYLVLGAVLASIGLWALAVTLPHTFSPGDEIKSAEMNANFQALKSAVDDLEAKLSAVQAAQKALPSKSGQLGYVWVKRDGTVNPTYAFMSNGNTPTVNKTGAGTYEVTFSGFNLVGGHVQVTTYVQDAPDQDNICAIDVWTATTVTVQCVDSDAGAGTLQDTSFTILVLR